MYSDLMYLDLMYSNLKKYINQQIPGFLELDFKYTQHHFLTMSLFLF